MIRQNIAGLCQQTFCFQKFADKVQQCFFAFTPLHREEEGRNSDQNFDQKSKHILKTFQSIKILKVRFVKFYLANLFTYAWGSN